MLKPRLLLKPTQQTTRLYLTLGGNELLRAVLPAVLPAPGTWMHPRSAPILLEGLALWLQRPLSAVLYAADGDDSSALGLSDGFGFGYETVHYEVEVVDRSRRGRRLGSFADLRQLQLRGAL
jgi:hypothetical protein